MATLQTLLDDLNDRTNDASNTQASQALKIGYINQGIRAMWPRVYRTLADTSIEIAEDTYEYAIPAAVGDHSLLTRVDIETGDATDRYTQLEEYEVLPLLSSRSLVLPRIPSEAGARIRILSAKRLSELSVVGDTYDGPPGTEEIPVWYALGIFASRRGEDRLDYTRFTTVAAENGVDINELMNFSQFCFTQFELLLERAAMPLPTQVG